MKRKRVIRVQAQPPPASNEEPEASHSSCPPAVVDMDTVESDEDPVPAIRAVIADHFATRRAERAPRAARNSRSRASATTPSSKVADAAAGVTQAADTFRASARRGYTERYLAANRARLLRDALRAEIDSGSKDSRAGQYWCVAGHRKRSFSQISLGRKYTVTPAEPDEARTLPISHAEWRTCVTLFRQMERFIANLKGGDTEANWEFLIEELLPVIPFEAIAALTPRSGPRRNTLNFLVAHTDVILDAAREEFGKGDADPKGKGRE